MAKYKHKVVKKPKNQLRVSLKIKKSHLWKIAFIPLSIIIIALFITIPPSGTGSTSSIGTKAINYINDYLVSPGVTASLIEVEELDNIYMLKIDIQGREYESYVTKDGSLFFTSGFNLDEAPERTNNQQGSQQGSNEDERFTVSADDDPSTGPEDAPVIIIEFSEFECPFCARVIPTIKQVIETYGDQVRLVFKDFPLNFHENAEKAAEAGECADDQGMFWEYYDLLFDNQDALDVASLKEYANDLGLNTEEFDECLDSGKHADEVQDDLLDGQALGVTGTPTFFINGKKLVGAQQFSAFQEIIDSELEGAS